MFLHLNHQKLEVYAIARQFVKECYFATNKFPAEEKYALTQQIRRAALSVHLNIAKEVPENRKQSANDIMK